MSDNVTIGIRLTADGAEVVGASKDAAAAIDKIGDSARRSGSEARRLNDALKSQQAQMATATDAARLHSTEMAVSAQKAQKLLDRYDPMSAKLRQLQADFKALNSAAQSGNIGAQDDARLDAVYARLQREMAAARAASAGFGATTKNAFEAAEGAANKAAFATVGARRELMVLGHEAVSGNFSRMPGSLMVLAERTGMSMTAFVGLGGAILGVAGTAAALIMAYKQGGDEFHAFSMALVMSGDAAHTTTGQLQMMSEAVASATGGTRHFAAEVLAELAAGGRVAAAGLQQAAQAAIDMERAGGQAASETVKQFNELGQSPVDASLKLNDTYRYLTESVYLQIKALEDQGNTHAAAALAQAAYADSVEKRSKDLKASLGTLQIAWIGLGDAAKGAWDFMMNVGRESSLEKQLADAKKAVENGGEWFGSLADARHKVNVLQAAVDNQRALAAAKDETNSKEQAGIKWQQSGEQYLSRKAQMWKEISRAEIEGVEAGRSQAEILQRIGEIQAKYATGTHRAAAPRETDFSRFAEQSAERLAVLKAEADGVTNLSETQKWALKIETDLSSGKLKATAAESARVRALLAGVLAQDEANRENADALQFSRDRAQLAAKDWEDINKQVESKRREVEVIGLTAEQLQGLTLSRLDEQIAMKTAEQSSAAATEGRAAEAGMIGEQIKQLQELRGLTATGYARQASADSAKKTQEEWKKVFSSMESVGKQAFVSIFTRDGKSAAEAMGKAIQASIIDLLYELTMKKWIVQIETSITGGAATQALGGSGSGFGGLLEGLFGNIGTAFTYGTNVGSQQTAMLAAQWHTGGGPGDTPAAHRMLPASVFADAPRFHTGIGPGERAAVITDTESVLTQGQMRQLAPVGSGSSNVTVNVIESPGNGGKQQQRSDGNGNKIIDIFIEQVKGSIASDISRGSGAIPAALGSTYRLNRSPGMF